MKRHLVNRGRERNSYMHTDDKVTCIFAANGQILLITWFVFEPICTVSDARCLLVVRVTIRPLPIRLPAAIQPIGCIPSDAIQLVQTKPVAVCVISALTSHSVQLRFRCSSQTRGTVYRFIQHINSCTVYVTAICSSSV